MDTQDSAASVTQWDLIERLKNLDDRESWNHFISDYRTAICRAAVRAGCTATEVEEVLQETAIAVARRIPTFETDPGRGSFEGWLLRLTHCRVVDQFRKRPKGSHVRAFSQEDLDHLDAEIARSGGRSVAPDLERSWDEEWEKHCITRALMRVRERIPSLHFDVFHRCLVLLNPPREVAAHLNTSVDQVYLIKHRVLARVRKELRRTLGSSRKPGGELDTSLEPQRPLHPTLGPVRMRTHRARRVSTTQK